jgi:hypothetical protein
MCRTNLFVPMLFVLLQRRIVAQNIKRLKDIGCYRGRRHIMVRRLLHNQPLDTLLCCQQPHAASACSCAHSLGSMRLYISHMQCTHLLMACCCSRTPIGRCWLWGRLFRHAVLHSVSLVLTYDVCCNALQGLPVRGQRTKTNARTRKGKPKTVAGKKK